LISQGVIDQRTIEKYQEEARRRKKENWWLTYIMDTNDEEREKNITIDIGEAYFNTSKKRWTILDAPGH
jgi:peptide chain release factor subunit 3